MEDQTWQAILDFASEGAVAAGDNVLLDDDEADELCERLDRSGFLEMCEPTPAGAVNSSMVVATPARAGGGPRAATRKRGLYELDMKGLTGGPQSEAKMLGMTAQRLLSKANETIAALDGKLSKLGQGWNQRMLAVGNQVRLPTESDPLLRTNGREWLVDGLLLEAYKAIGAKAVHHSRPTSRILDAIFLAQYAWKQFQSRSIRELFFPRTRTPEADLLSLPTDVPRPPCWLWYERASDATPMPLEFGIHQQAAAPVARYWKLVKEPGEEERWRNLRYEEYKALSTGVEPKHGTLEVLGMEGTLAWPVMSAKDPTSVAYVRTEKLPAHARCIAQNTASNLYPALDEMEPELSSEKLVELLSQGTRYAAIMDRTDDASQCNRFKAGYVYIFRQLLGEMRARMPWKPIGRLLYLASKCMSHKFKNILNSAAEADTMAAAMFQKFF